MGLIAGRTRSGQTIMASYDVNHVWRISEWADRFSSEDHFDAYCVFHYLSGVEFDRRGFTEFYDHFIRLASFHKAIHLQKTLSDKRPATHDYLTSSEVRALGARLVLSV